MFNTILYDNITIPILLTGKSSIHYSDFVTVLLLLTIILITVLLIQRFRFEKRRESLLSRADLKYQHLFNSAIDALYILDSRMRVAEVNPVGCSRLGYTEEEMIGLPLIRIDSPRFADQIPGRIDAIHKDGGTTFESAHLTKKGEEIPVEVSVKRLEIGGKTYFFSIARDITERVRNEQIIRERELKYRAVIETSADGFWMIDLEGNFLEVNDAYLNMSGYTREEILTMNIRDVETIENPEEIKKHINKVNESGHDRFETIHRKKNGDTWPVEIVVSYRTVLPDRQIVFIVDITERKKYEKRINDLALFPEQNPNPVMRLSPDGEILYKNKSAEAMIHEMVVENNLPLPGKLLECATDAYNTKTSCTIEIKFDDHHYLFCVAPVTEQFHMNIYGMDITRHVRDQEKIQILSRAITQSPVSVMITDLNGLITYVNPKFTEVSGYTAEEVTGKNPRILKSGRQSKEFYKNMWDTIRTGKEWKGEFANLTRDGKEYWESASISAVMDMNNQPISFIAVKEDITEKKKKEERIHFLAMHDTLTRLYNRTAFMDHLARNLHRAERTETGVTLLFMDLNGFKEINDTYGHQAGDETIAKVANDLISSVRQMDIVARMGGDEFAVILPDTVERSQIDSIILRIFKALEKPVRIGSILIHVGASIGVSIYREGHLPLEKLFHCADRAMYAAKRKGNNEFVYCSDLDDE